MHYLSETKFVHQGKFNPEDYLTIYFISFSILYKYSSLPNTNHNYSINTKTNTRKKIYYFLLVFTIRWLTANNSLTTSTTVTCGMVHSGQGWNYDRLQIVAAVTVHWAAQGAWHTVTRLTRWTVIVNQLLMWSVAFKSSLTMKWSVFICTVMQSIMNMLLTVVYVLKEKKLRHFQVGLLCQ